jgi:hypothetical protein
MSQAVAHLDEMTQAERGAVRTERRLGRGAHRKDQPAQRPRRDLPHRSRAGDPPPLPPTSRPPNPPACASSRKLPSRRPRHRQRALPRRASRLRCRRLRPARSPTAAAVMPAGKSSDRPPPGATPPRRPTGADLQVCARCIFARRPCCRQASTARPPRDYAGLRHRRFRTGAPMARWAAGEVSMSSNLRIDGERLVSRLAALSKPSARPRRAAAGGWRSPTRTSRAATGWSPRTDGARSRCPKVDAIGNIVGILKGQKEGPAVILGSHIDTVGTGGRYRRRARRRSAASRCWRRCAMPG